MSTSTSSAASSMSYVVLVALCAELASLACVLVNFFCCSADAPAAVAPPPQWMTVTYYRPVYTWLPI